MKPLVFPDRPADWNNPYGYIPKGLHWELLKAIYLEENAQALENWSKNCDVDTTDTGMLRLLPLLYRRIASDRTKHPLTTRLKSKYRYTLYRNHLFLNRLKNVVRELERQRIPCLFVKGLAMMVAYYRDLGLRPMNDWDISVPFEKYHDAVSILQDAGFKPQIQVTEAYRHLRSSQGWEDSDGFEIDLHWRVLPGFFRQDIPGIWENLETTDFRGLQVHIPEAEVCFVTTALHGLKPNPVAPVRWICDCIEILNTSGPRFDWPRAFSLSNDPSIEDRLKAAMHIVHTLQPKIPIPWNFDRPFEPDSIDEHFSPIDSNQGFWSLFRHNLSLYNEISGRENVWAKISHFPKCLRYHLSVDDEVALTRDIAQRTFRRIPIFSRD